VKISTFGEFTGRDVIGQADYGLHKASQAGLLTVIKEMLAAMCVTVDQLQDHFD